MKHEKAAKAAAEALREVFEGVKEELNIDSIFLAEEEWPEVAEKVATVYLKAAGYVGPLV